MPCGSRRHATSVMPERREQLLLRVFERIAAGLPADDRRQQVPAAAVVVERDARRLCHRPVEHEADPVGAALHLQHGLGWIVDSGSRQLRPEVLSSRCSMVIAFLRASASATLRPGKKSSTGASRRSSLPSLSAMPTSVPTTPFVTEFTRVLHARPERRVVRVEHDRPCRTTSKLSISLAAPKSTRSASAADDMPCSSGEDVCHPFVGHAMESAASDAMGASQSATRMARLVQRAVAPTICMWIPIQLTIGAQA